MRVVALDLSLAATGIATLDDDHGWKAGTVKTRMTGWARVTNVREEIFAALRHVRPELIITEGYGPIKGFGATPLRLAELRGHVLASIWESPYNVPVAVVAPTSLKLYITGKGGGKGVNKMLVMNCVRIHYGHLVDTFDDNQADAVGLLAMALHHYTGFNPVEPTALCYGKIQKRAMSKVEWPEVKISDYTAPRGLEAGADSW